MSVTTMSADAELLVALQAHGVAVETEADVQTSLEAGASPGRRGGAGPSDHRPVSLGATTVMIPMRAAGTSPYKLRVLDGRDGGARGLLLRDDQPVAEVGLPGAPRFYALRTAAGVPYTQIALLHARGVLASTVMQSCVRYNDAAKACRFCAIGTSLAAGRTLPRKSPAQLAEVAAAAVRLDGVEQLVLTTGTPATTDRGAAHLADCAAAVRAAVPALPIQVQCEPPDDFAWFTRLRQAGADTLGMHLEAVEPAVRAAVMPGKAEVPVAFYLQAYAAAVSVFGWGQVSTYLIAGLGDHPGSLIAMADRLLQLGVYPFLVPFAPIAGTPFADRPAPPAAMMSELYRAVAALVRHYGITSAGMKAGCGKCGACSALAAHEVAA